MVVCRGTLDLWSFNISSLSSSAAWKPVLHRTHSSSEIQYERSHVRTVLTPVGCPLNMFPSTRALAQAINIAAFHLEIAYLCGVLHRDVSEGNILFQELSLLSLEPNALPLAFLLDWDYAEFVKDLSKEIDGVTAFNREFPLRRRVAYDDVDQRLKDFTGTTPFMALELSGFKESVLHHNHHDLESLYWLLIWMVLRHTQHTHPQAMAACDHVFKSALTKAASLHAIPPVSSTTPLRSILTKLRDAVLAQNPPATDEAAAPLPTQWHLEDQEEATFIFSPSTPRNPVYLDFTSVRTVLDAAIRGLEHDWPENDAALPERDTSEAADAHGPGRVSGKKRKNEG